MIAHCLACLLLAAPATFGAAKLRVTEILTPQPTHLRQADLLHIMRLLCPSVCKGHLRTGLLLSATAGFAAAADGAGVAAGRLRRATT